jgi:signal transduction histidine kinase
MAEAARRRAKVGDEQETNEYIVRLGELAQQSLKEMRLLVYELQPAALEENDLAGALQARLDAVERRAGMDARLRVDLGQEIPPRVQVQLYRIAEEALNNALKHASASKVSIDIRSTEAGITLIIGDNGNGFVANTAASSGGMGLISMRERATNLGGALKIKTEPGKGTTVQLTLKTTDVEDKG